MKGLGLTAGSIQGIDDLPALPVLTRALVRANHDDIIVRAEVTAEIFTGGTTGERLKWAATQKWGDLFNRCLYRGFGWAGLRRDTRLVCFFSRNAGLVADTSLIFREPFDRRTIEAQLAETREFKPRAFYGYASSAYILARYLRERGRRLPLGTVVTTSEPLLPEWIEPIETAFETKVYDNYGCNEGGSWGAQCAERRGFHHDFERNIIEFVDGRMLATDLWNTAFPFIRYENGDSGRWLEEGCACGRQSPRFEIAGRMSDLIITPTQVVGPTSLGSGFAYNGIVAARVVQHSARDVEVLIVANDSFTDEGYSERREMLLRRLDGMNVAFRFVDSIPTSYSGKHRVSINLSGLTPDKLLGNE